MPLRSSRTLLSTLGAAAFIAIGLCSFGFDNSVTGRTARHSMPYSFDALSGTLVRHAGVQGEVTSSIPARFVAESGAGIVLELESRELLAFAPNVAVPLSDAATGSVVVELGFDGRTLSVIAGS